MTNPDSAMAAATPAVLKVFCDFVHGCFVADEGDGLSEHSQTHNNALAIAIGEILDPQDNRPLVEALDTFAAIIRKHQAQEIAELVAGLRQARNYFIGLSAYLATCNTDVIIENLETTIAALHREERKVESLLSRYPKV